jgi:SAM-dependent methyltransferase
MNRKLLEILACPACKSALSVSTEDLEIEEAVLTCEKCGMEYMVTNGIPRFVEPENYASSFGYQWNLFRKAQIDSFNGTTLSKDRLWSETGWDEANLCGRWVLDVGCGAGRFLDVVSHSGGQIVGVDISNAIDAAKVNLVGRDNVHFVQASIYELPFRDGTFDFCYCIGVVQHTPDTEKSLRAIGSMVKEGGELALTIYPRKLWTRLYSKYWWRPITKRMEKERLLNIINSIMPFAIPVTDVLFRIPKLGRAFKFLIPIANYVHEKQLTREQRYNWAILDTFDMLSPQFDQPLTESEVRKPLEASGIKISKADKAGLYIAGQRRTNCK